MKKIKLVLTIPALVAVSPATMVLSNCGANKNDPVIDSQDVTQTIVRNSDGSVTCNLTPKSELNKITDVSVKIGDTTLVKSTDYSVASTNGGSLSLTIFKATLEKYSGKIVVSPVLKTYNGIIYTIPKTTYVKGTTITKSDLNVFKSYEGVQGEQIPWTDTGLTLWHDNVDITTTFKSSGYTCSVVGTQHFAVHYGSYTKSFDIEVENQKFTITCSTSGSCLSLSATSITVEEGQTWGQVTKPTISYNTDVNSNALTTKWCYEDQTTEIPEDKVIDSSFKAVLVYDFANPGTAIADPYACQLLRESGSSFNCRCYVHSVDESTPNPIPSDYDSIYTFECNLKTLSGSFDYFWVGMKTTTQQRVVKLYPENILGIYLVDNTTPTEIKNVGYDFISDNNYIQYKETFTTCDKTLRVVYRPLVAKDTNVSLYPGFEADLWEF